MLWGEGGRMQDINSSWNMIGWVHGQRIVHGPSFPPLDLQQDEPYRLFRVESE